jgi:methylmalonyl-CoA decarboxylase subunit alpha
VMGPEGAVNIIFRKQIEAADDPDATRADMIDGIRRTIDPYIAAGNALIDDIIDPRETRPTVIRALEMAETKRVQRPWRKHGVMPV